LMTLASEQAGVLTREQVIGHGLGEASLRRLRESGRWQQITRGIYFTETSDPPWLTLAWTGVLWGGDRARLALDAASHLHGIRATEPDVIAVQVPHGSPHRARGPWHFVQERDGIRRCSRGEPPRTDVEDTVLDLCDGADGATCVDLITRAVQQRLTTTARLRRRLEGRQRHVQRSRLVTILSDVEEGAESPLELSYLTDVERRHGLPNGRRQHRRRGTVRDVYYDLFATVVELDGRAGHEGVGRHRDMRRDNRSALAGETTLRYGWWDVLDRPCLVAAEVAAVLAARGWDGLPELCPKCERARTVDGFAV
jgi:hypothetical protein